MQRYTLGALTYSKPGADEGPCLIVDSTKGAGSGCEWRGKHRDHTRFKPLFAACFAACALAVEQQSKNSHIIRGLGSMQTSLLPWLGIPSRTLPPPSPTPTQPNPFNLKNFKPPSTRSDGG